MFNKNCHKSTVHDMFVKTDSYTLLMLAFGAIKTYLV